MTRPVRGRLNPLWLQKQAERRRLAKTAHVNKQRAEVPLLESSQAKAAKAKYAAWKEAEKERKRNEAKAARDAARQEAEEAVHQKTKSARGNNRRRGLTHYQALKGQGYSTLSQPDPDS